MRSGVWLLILPLSFGGCSGGYPLEPTPCDELCHLTKGPGCAEDYQPAACVVSCEQSHFDAEPCRQLRDAMIACYRATPGAAEQRCDYWTPLEQHACAAEYGAFATCVSFFGEW
ncbi:MAG: hypothetical protein EOO73_25545 [Myxococcales bacterium]|nr:MAG: hypothetical protein EOO73_25545 [Myxococcales bacterium]